MKWFKHYSNATHSEKLANLIDELGFEGYGRYWRILEFLASNFDGAETVFRVNKRLIRDIIRIRSKVKADNYLTTIGELTGIKVSYDNLTYEFTAPILAELKSRDFKRARTSSAAAVPRIDKDKDKDKDKETERPRLNVSANAKNKFILDEVQELFIKKCVGGRVKHPPFFSRESVENFTILKGFITSWQGWVEFFDEVVKSDFLMGKSNSFVVSFNWLMKPENAEKVLSGAYSSIKNIEAADDLKTLDLEG